jgi:hypothetical protein
MMVRTLYVCAFLFELAGIALGTGAFQRRSAALGVLLSAADDLIRWRQAPPTNPAEIERANTFVNRVLEARCGDLASRRRNRAVDYGAIISLITAAFLALLASLVWYSQP